MEKYCSLDNLMYAIHPAGIEPCNWESIICQFKEMFSFPEPVTILDYLRLETFALGSEDGVSHCKPILDLPPIYSPTGELSLSAFINTSVGDFLPSSKRVGDDRKHQYPWFHDYASMTWQEAFRSMMLDERVMGDSPYVAMRGAPAQEVIDLLFDSGRPTQWGKSDVMASLKAATIYRQITVEICHTIHATVCGRCLFVTDNGFLGLGPTNLRVVDSVNDLLGGDVPFVLRETENPGEFTLLGDSYVHGIMDRELWRKSEDEKALESVDGRYTWEDIVLV